MMTLEPKTWTKPEVIEAVRSGYDKLPCLRCGDQQHTLVVCKNITNKEGPLWRALGLRQDWAVTELNKIKKEILSERRADAAPPPSSQPAPMTMDQKRAAALEQIESRKKAKGQSDNSQTTFPHRVDGFRGADRNVAANYFDISIEPGIEFYEYEILGLPPGRDRERLSPLVKNTIGAFPFLDQNMDKFATDHISTIIAWKKFHSDEEMSDDIVEWGPRIISDGRDNQGRQRSRPVSIRFIRKLEIALLNEYSQAKGNTQDLWKSSPEIRALNILISNCFDSKKVVQVSANKFFIRDSKKSLATKDMRSQTALCTMEGYFYTIKPTMTGIKLNVNTATSAFYDDTLLSEYLADSTTFPSKTQKLAAMKGLRVQIMYRRGANAGVNVQLDSDEDGRKKTIQG